MLSDFEPLLLRTYGLSSNDKFVFVLVFSSGFERCFMNLIFFGSFFKGIFELNDLLIFLPELFEASFKLRFVVSM